MFSDLLFALHRVTVIIAAANCLLHVRPPSTELALQACALREALAKVTVTEAAVRAVFEEGVAAGRAVAAAQADAEITRLRQELAAAQAPALRAASGESARRTRPQIRLLR